MFPSVTFNHFQLIAYLVSCTYPHPLLAPPGLTSCHFTWKYLYFYNKWIIFRLCFKFLIIQNQSWQLHLKILAGFRKNVGRFSHTLITEKGSPAKKFSLRKKKKKAYLLCSPKKKKKKVGFSVASGQL